MNSISMLGQTLVVGHTVTLTASILVDVQDDPIAQIWSNIGGEGDAIDMELDNWCCVEGGAQYIYYQASGPKSNV